MELPSITFNLLRNSPAYSLAILLALTCATVATGYFLSPITPLVDLALQGVVVGVAGVFVFNLAILALVELFLLRLSTSAPFSFNFPYSRERTMVRVSKVFSEQKFELLSLRNLLGGLTMQVMKHLGNSIDANEVFYSLNPLVVIWLQPKPDGSTVVRLYNSDTQDALKIVELIKINLSIK